MCAHVGRQTYVDTRMRQAQPFHHQHYFCRRRKKRRSGT